MKVMINTFAKFVDGYQRQHASPQDIGAIDELVALWNNGQPARWRLADVFTGEAMSNRLGFGGIPYS